MGGGISISWGHKGSVVKTGKEMEKNPSFSCKKIVSIWLKKAIAEESGATFQEGENWGLDRKTPPGEWRASFHKHQSDVDWSRSFCHLQRCEDLKGPSDFSDGITEMFFSCRCSLHSKHPMNLNTALKLPFIFWQVTIRNWEWGEGLQGTKQYNRDFWHTCWEDTEKNGMENLYNGTFEHNRHILSWKWEKTQQKQHKTPFHPQPGPLRFREFTTLQKLKPSRLC